MGPGDHSAQNDANNGLCHCFPKMPVPLVRPPFAAPRVTTSLLGWVGGMGVRQRRTPHWKISLSPRRDTAGEGEGVGPVRACTSGRRGGGVRHVAGGGAGGARGGHSGGLWQPPPYFSRAALPPLHVMAFLSFTKFRNLRRVKKGSYCCPKPASNGCAVSLCTCAVSAVMCTPNFGPIGTEQASISGGTVQFLLSFIHQKIGPKGTMIYLGNQASPYHSVV